MARRYGGGTGSPWRNCEYYINWAYSRQSFNNGLCACDQALSHVLEVADYMFPGAYRWENHFKPIPGYPLPES